MGADGAVAGLCGVQPAADKQSSLPASVDRTWSLFAGHGDGPQIACTPAVLVCEKLAARALQLEEPPIAVAPHAGATPCVGLFTLKEVTKSLQQCVQQR